MSIPTDYKAEYQTSMENTLNQHQPGFKDDFGKNRLGLLFRGFSRALWEVGLVATFGAVKYTDDGWCAVVDAERRYTDALYRHLLLASQGEELDPDSQLSHAAHAAWNALAVLELKLRQSNQ